ncbi:MAG TPA: hypothetical protein EYM97_06265 [Gemmatimonadetes bacterium]|nr:hypothetical protein [Gemmatimonadota bacterium]
MTLDILDQAGSVVNSYSSAQLASGGGGRGGGFGGRGGGAPPPSVTTNTGFNRMVWNVRDTEGLSVPPGQYQARLSVGGESQTQRFNVLIDPRVEARGVTVADLREQYEHNKKMNAMVSEVDALIERVRAAQESGDADLQRRIAPIAERLITAPIRYSSPGLSDHITYLRGMTARVDMKIGRDAIARHEVLRVELDDITREANGILGSGN